MALCTGYMGKSYDIDLSTGEIKILDISQHVDLYLGGKGVGTRLLYDNTPPGMDPYDDRMPLIFSTVRGDDQIAPHGGCCEFDLWW